MNLHEMLAASSGAIFSDCKKYRFILWRIWDFSNIKPRLMFIGLNPSTADDREPDPTIKRVVGLAKKWGYGGIYMANLFPFITPYPEQLEENPLDRVKENDKYLEEYSKKSGEIVFAWGAFPVMGRDLDMIKKFPNSKCLHINDDGTPQHPLYVPKNTILQPYQPVK